MKTCIRPFVPAALAAAVLAACGGGDNANVNTRPAYLGTVKVTAYDGMSDDLLTAGLGKTGLASPWPPPMPTRSSPRRPSCAVRPSTPTTAPCST